MARRRGRRGQMDDDARRGSPSRRQQLTGSTAARWRWWPTFAASRTAARCDIASRSARLNSSPRPTPVRRSRARVSPGRRWWRATLLPDEQQTTDGPRTYYYSRRGARGSATFSSSAAAEQPGQAYSRNRKEDRNFLHHLHVLLRARSVRTLRLGGCQETKNGAVASKTPLLLLVAAP